MRVSEIRVKQIRVNKGLCVVQLLIYDVDLGMQLCQKSVVCPTRLVS